MPTSPRSTRRVVLATGVTGAAAAVAGLCLRTSRATPGASEFSDVTFGAHRGALFEPTSVPASQPCPLILLFDPGGDAHAIVRRYSSAARAHGWMAASCSDIRNGTSDDADTEAMMALLAFVSARRAVDGSRVFAGGLSGGACGAYRLAIVRSDAVHGAIVECGHMGSWREVGARASSALRFYLFTRDEDFNRPATRALRDAMVAKGCRVTEVEAPGGHAPMDPEQVEAAISWMAAT